MKAKWTITSDIGCTAAPYSCRISQLHSTGVIGISKSVDHVRGQMVVSTKIRWRGCSRARSSFRGKRTVTVSNHAVFPTMLVLGLMWFTFYLVELVLVSILLHTYGTSNETCSYFSIRPCHTWVMWSCLLMNIEVLQTIGKSCAAQQSKTSFSLSAHHPKFFALGVRVWASYNSVKKIGGVDWENAGC